MYGNESDNNEKGEPFIETHWDGYPSSLGKELMNCKTDKEIIEVTKKHTIDCAHESIVKKLNDER